MVNEDIEEKIKKLQLIKDEIKEDINKIKIDDNTILTLKDKGYKFKVIDHYFGTPDEDESMIESIKDRSCMSYDYCLKNKFNYFDSEKKVKAFFNFFKMTLTSKVMREFYEKVISFKDYEYPLDNENIVNYLTDKIIFTEIDPECWGITNREGFGIFINRLKGEKTIGLGNGAYLITVSHEVSIHKLRNLINSNSGMEASTVTPNESFINEEDNKITIGIEDGGEKFEILAFGQKNPLITIGGNHYLFNINNWNQSLQDFKKGFQKNNIKKNVELLKKELNLLKKDKLVKELFEDIDYNNVSDDINSQSMPSRKCIGKIYRNSDFV